MDSRDNGMSCLLPALGIIQNKLRLLKSHMAHAQCMRFLKVRLWGIHHFNHFITSEIGMFTSRFWT